MHQLQPGAGLHQYKGIQATASATGSLLASRVGIQQCRQLISTGRPHRSLGLAAKAAASLPSNMPSASASTSTAAVLDFPGTGATTIDHLPHTQKYVLADEWGFQQVGGSFPEGTPSYVIAEQLPDELLERDTLKGLVSLALPLALIVTGVAWMSYWTGLCPIWQKLLCWISIGTGYTGLFAVAHDAARMALLPDRPRLNDFIGSLLMAPSLFSLESWRLRFLNHVALVNAIGMDIHAWHPLTTYRVAELAVAAAFERMASGSSASSSGRESSNGSQVSQGGQGTLSGPLDPPPASATSSKASATDSGSASAISSSTLGASSQQTSSSSGPAGATEHGNDSAGASTSTPGEINKHSEASTSSSTLPDKPVAPIAAVLAVLRAVFRLPPFPAARLALAIEWLASCTPLKFLASIGAWLKHFDSFDLRAYHQLERVRVWGSWMWPIAFAGFGLPAIMTAAGGAGGLVDYWLMPWLVFHVWLSTLALVRHSAPHIPWRPPGEGWDQGAAAVSGCVTVTLPAPIEAAINHLNYPLPHQISPAIPFYQTKKAHAWLAARLGPYITQTTLSARLLTNHVTLWQVYNPDTESYQRLEDVLQAVRQEVQDTLTAIAAGPADADTQVSEEADVAASAGAGVEAAATAGAPASAADAIVVAVSDAAASAPVAAAADPPTAPPASSSGSSSSAGPSTGAEKQ